MLLLPSPALAQSAASFEKHPVALGFDGMHAVEAADLDGDGDVDLLGAAMNASDIVWWENASGDGETWSLHLVADAFASARYVFATDLDTDGDLDLVGAAAIADAIAWWENTDGVAGAWTMHTVTDSFDFAMHVRSADMDGDGDPDLVAAALKADAIAWWENTDGAAGAWVEHAIDTAFNGARHVAPVDLDGDGDMDVLAAADVGDEVAWWENTDGAGTAWSKHGIEAGFDGANSAHPVDVDNDGDLDIIGSADAADQVVWWENDGNAQGWARHVIDPAFNGAFSTFPVDLDGDEDVDVVAAAAEGDLISWWENVLGDGTEWVEHPIESVFDFATHVCAVDMDGDGDRDVIGGRFGGEVNWWENTSDVPVLPVELTRFDAVASGDRVTLQWETASETGNAGFEVQRGLDGRFYPLAFVDGAGTSSEPRRYAFTVSGIEAGRHAFRLKQIDFDGGFSYSREQTVFVGVNGPYKSASVYPNPFNPNAEFTLTLGSPQHVRVEVYNTMGQRVALLHEGALDAERPYGFQFDAAGLPGGLYLFQASGERFSTTETALLVK
ncbi:MAG: FG-GAP-like repeat-containing protein [Rhodothermales bacterium]